MVVKVRSDERVGARQPGRVVTFGEAMIRMTPPGHERLERSQQLDLTVGGAELNVAVGLRCLDVPSAFVTCLPDNSLGRLIERQARASGVDVSTFHWVDGGTDRVGLYFLEQGTDPRPSAVTYDRAQSAFARIAAGSFDWPVLLAGASLLHISGITPALSEGCRSETFAAIRAANAAGIPVAFDLNYRSKLWSEAEARACFIELVPLVDILFTSRGGLRTFFGFEGDHETVLREARDRLGLAVVALTRKKSKGSRTIQLASMALGQSNKIAVSDWCKVEIVDRLGGGDAFAAGFIAGYLEQPDDLTHAVRLGTAACALKHTVPGDFLCATRAEIEAVTSAISGALER